MSGLFTGLLQFAVVDTLVTISSVVIYFVVLDSVDVEAHRVVALSRAGSRSIAFHDLHALQEREVSIMEIFEVG